MAGLIRTLAKRPSSLQMAGLNSAARLKTTPALLIPHGDFSRPEDVDDWGGGSGLASIVSGRFRLTRDAGAIGRRRHPLVVSPNTDYLLTGEFIKTAINCTFHVNNSSAGVGSPIATQTISASGFFGTSGTGTVFNSGANSLLYLWLSTGTGSDGQYVEFDNVACALAA